MFIKLLDKKLLAQRMHSDWAEILHAPLNTKYGLGLLQRINKARQTINVYPAKDNLWRVFKYSPQDYNVLILGESPYPYEDADGLAFSAKGAQFCPPSLSKIIDSVSDTVYDSMDVSNWNNFDLERWAKQGVMLLNTMLTVTPYDKHEEWLPITRYILERTTFDVALLWGNYAKKFEQYINADCVITATHPAYAHYNQQPWNCNNCFNQTNKILNSLNKKEIIW